MPGGRPRKITDTVVAKLEEAFRMGCTDAEACLYADINPATLYRYCEQNPKFSERKETLKTNPVLKAKGIQLQALEDGDKQVALDLLKRKEGSKVTVEGGDKPVKLDTPWEITGVKVVDRDGRAEG